MAIVGRWIDLIFKTATGSMKTKLILTPVIGLLYFGFILVFVFLSMIADRAARFPSILGHPWNLAVGVPVMAAGFILMALSVAYFIRVKGTPVPFNPPPSLITTGPYAFARNPMLTGIFLQLFGLGAYIHSLSLILFFTPLFIAINFWELKKVEEPELARRLGREYIEYKKRVPMFFPWFSKKS